MNYRNEVKHEISYSDMLCLRSRLRAVMQQDEHCIDGKYLIRSLYFDTPSDTALREKLDGVNMREKFRLRYYNCDTSLIHLEKKSKLNSLCSKQSVTVDEQLVRDIINGNLNMMLEHEDMLVAELYAKMSGSLLKPKAIVEYTREPFVFVPGNVRVTIDYDLRTSIGCDEFLSSDCKTIPIEPSPIILEVKWDEFLPTVIRDIVQLENRRSGAFSKYAACRTYTY